MCEIFSKNKKWFLILILSVALFGCQPKVKFWIANETESDYKIEILFKKKYNQMGFNALFGFHLNSMTAVARTPIPSYDNMFFQSDVFKKEPIRLTETEFQYDPNTGTFSYLLKPKAAFLLEETSDPESSYGVDLIQELKIISKDGEILYRGKEIRKLFLSNKYFTLVLK